MPARTFLVEAVEKRAERGGGCASSGEGEQALQGCGAAGVSGYLCECDVQSGGGLYDWLRVRHLRGFLSGLRGGG
jgi:hypothetical protein